MPTSRTGCLLIVCFSFQDDSVSATQSQKRKFTDEQLVELIEKCKSIIAGGPVIHQRVLDCLGNSVLLDLYTFPQIRTRIMYKETKKQREDKNLAIDEYVFGAY